MDTEGVGVGQAAVATVSVSIEPARQAELVEMMRLGDQFALELYPPESCFLLDLSELESAGIEVFVAREAAAGAKIARHGSERLALGMVALIDNSDGTGEIKRMFVLESARGRGVARALLDPLEARAAERGIRLLRLETGTEHTAALSLYLSLGYRRIARFGPYVDSEFSVCMEKQLVEARARS